MNTYGYIKSDEMSGYAIVHHGIKGQKWGVRRFQNEDGSLTDLGAKRYGVKATFRNGLGKKDTIYNGDALNKRGLKTKNIDRDAFNKYQQEEKRKAEEIANKRRQQELKEIKEGKKLLSSKISMIDQDGDSLRKDPKRSKNAAITGLKAMSVSETGHSRSGDQFDPNKGNIDWFLYEDQTLGMPTVADLANQGYSTKQIKSIITAVQNMDYDDYRNNHNTPGYFGLREYHAGDNFIENCVKYRQKK